MSSSRLTEKWINRFLWLIAIVFAAFLTGLGSLIIQDLPKVQTNEVMQDFVDKEAYSKINADIKSQEKLIEQVQNEYNQKQSEINRLQDAYYKSKEAFDNWSKTRLTTEDSRQNPELIKRTKDLESEQNAIQEQVKISYKISDKLAEHNNQLSVLNEKKYELEKVAQEQLDKVLQKKETQIFLIRLLVTLPLLLIGAWLFVKKRKTAYWPYVWGFIFFALFAFFFELVPYLPSYGGYVRFWVGIVLTFFVGHYATKYLQKYLENQKKAEQQPNTEIKKNLTYEVSLARMSKGICPSCERVHDYKDVTKNFCIHCGVCLFNNCKSCNARKNALAKFCHSCGVEGL